MRLGATKSSATSSYNGLGNQLWDLGGARPSLDLNFAGNKNLTDSISTKNLITFTRASSGTYVGSDRLIKTATTDEARFTHNPTTGESLGLLIEPQRVNSLLASEDFSAASWSTTSATITANTATAPDGLITANLWSNTGSPGVLAHSVISKAAGANPWTASLWVKNVTEDFSLTVDDNTTTNRGRVVFNLVNGTIVSTTNDGNFTNTSGTITPYPNGWYRITTTTTTNTTTSVRFRAFFSVNGATALIWGAQLEAGVTVSSYIPTTTATVTRSADVASITGSNFSSWYNQTEGTIFCESSSAAFSTATLSISDNTADNRILVDKGTSGFRFLITTATASQLPTFQVPYTLNTSAKVSAGFALNNVNWADDGVIQTVDTNANLPSVDRLNIGTNAIGSGFLNGTIKRITYWPSRLPDSNLTYITQ